MRPTSPKALLRAAKLPALLITNKTNIRYLIGAELSAGFLLVTGNRYRLFVDGRYHEAATHFTDRHLRVLPLSALEASMKEIRRCGIESETVTIQHEALWKRKFKSTKLIHTQGIVEEFRRAKDSMEIKKFRVAQRITQNMMKRVPKALKPGISEKELSWLLRSWAHELHADGMAFDPIVAFGENTSRPHHRGADRRFRKGDLVQIDVGAKFGGYCADQSAVFFTGAKTTKQRTVLKLVRQAKREAIRAVKAGVTTHALDRIVQTLFKNNGFANAFPHSLGHGVGLDIHEGVSLSLRRPAQKLRKGEIITIEPGLYFPGEFGIRLESEVVVS